MAVSPSPKITDYIESALAAGLPQTSVVGMLSAHGWSEKEIYSGLAEYYRRSAGLEVPQRAGSGAAARDAFFYLLAFTTLGTWTIGFATLAFALVDRWLADPLFPGRMVRFDAASVASSLASLLIAFPLYLLISRSISRDVQSNPAKAESAVRRWLTYMALVIAASVFLGDAITALTYLLRGEFTSRFVLKVMVVLALSGGVFFYYFGDLRRGAGMTGTGGRDRSMAGVSSGLVALLAVLGFLRLGAPRVQRDYRADQQRESQLYQLSKVLEQSWVLHKTQPQQLPRSLGEMDVPGGKLDPVSGREYVYEPGQGSQYKLCARFARETDPHTGMNGWQHSAGPVCFNLDAQRMTSPPPYMGY